MSKLATKIEGMEQSPSDEYGPVRDRRKEKPLGLVSWKRIPRCPSRELAFSPREGCWRYDPPSIASSDPLGSMRDFSERPSTRMVIPDAYGDEDSSPSSHHPTANDYERRNRKRLKDGNPGEQTKSPRMEGGDEEPGDTRMGGTSAVDVVASESSPSSSSP